VGYTPLRVLLLTQYCERPIFADSFPNARKIPGVIKLHVVDIERAVSVIATADAHSCFSVKSSVDSVAGVNDNRLTTLKRKVFPAEFRLDRR